MPDNTSLINLGELSKPATVLIEKISEATGGIFKPWQIRRVAQAEADAEIIKANAKIEITDLQERALYRFILEEGKKQRNIESITSKALSQVQDTSTPQNMEDDWILNFFDKCRLISDEEMQVLWSKILSGEANSPGTFSKRTISFLSSMDKSDALLFQSLCNFGLHFIPDDIVPLVFDTQSPVYMNHGIDFVSLKHLDEIGLISFDTFGSYKRMHVPQKILADYFGRQITIQFENQMENELNVGHVMLSKAGQELVRICGAHSITDFLDYALEQLKFNRSLSRILEVRADS
jgi:Protein of unknown function (DUF2806)